MKKTNLIVLHFLLFVSI